MLPACRGTLGARLKGILSSQSGAWLRSYCLNMGIGNHEEADR